MIPISYNVRNLAVRKTTTLASGIGLALVVFVVALSHPSTGLAAALTYALAYTVELTLSLVSYFGNQPL